MSRPVTNHALAELLAEASFQRSLAAFARGVNRAAADRYGLVLRYDGASVYWWLRGRCPEQPAPELIAEVLSARIGRRVEAADLGFTRVSGDLARALRFPTSLGCAIDTATGLWRHLTPATSGGTAPEGSAAFAAEQAEQAGWRWRFDPAEIDVARRGGRRVTAQDVAALRICVEQFLDLDRRHGGGHARAFLADFLTRDVAPLLRGTYTDPVGRELFSVAAELTAMAAFMTYDVGDQPAAQRAWIQALRLAKAAGDRVQGAHILANLATQAIALHLPRQAVRLATAALDGAGHRPHPAAAARLHTTQANAHALAGDLTSYRTAYGRARSALDRAAGGGPAWARYFSPAHLAGTAMRSLLDLDRPAEAIALHDQILDLGPANTRTRALHTALSATAHARAGHLDQAATLAQLALFLARPLRSRRVTDRIGQLAQALQPHRTLPDVADFLDQAVTMLQPAHAHRPRQ